jgi:hypothetical protein
MSEENEQPSRLQMLNRLFWRGVIIAGLVIAGLGLSGALSEIIIKLGIEFISVTNISMTFLGFWVMFSAAIAESLTDRVFKKLGKK